MGLSGRLLWQSPMSHPEPSDAPVPTGSEELRRAEAALRRLGFARVPPAVPHAVGEPAFWVQESGVPRRTFPVYLPSPAPAPARAGTATKSPPPQVATRAIVVVDGDKAAERAWETLRRPGGDPAAELSILVLPSSARADGGPRWHTGTVSPKELLRLATGVVVGLFRRAQSEEGGPQIDFVELLKILRTRFGVDVHRSLGVETDEDALFLLYQLAQRDTYAPGESGANLHVLVLKPAGPAARLPWFAA